MKRSKKYQKAAEKVDSTKVYSIEEATKLLPEVSISSFAGTVELTLHLNVKDKQKKETIRGSYTLPHKFGEEAKVLVFADQANQKNAKTADTVGGEELIEKVEKGEVEFDVVIATPAMMPKIARLGKTLGVKGLMPNPKNGTITENPDEVIKEYKSGRRNYKMADSGKITAVIGKADMKQEELIANYEAFFTAIANDLRKLGMNPIKSVVLAPTMGPSIKVEPVKLG